jgi:chromosome segregation ATPase
MHRKIDSSRGAAAGAAEDVKRIEADILRMERDLHEMHREIAVNNERKAALDADIADTERAVDTLRGEVSRFREEAAADRARLKSLEEVVSGGLDIEALKQRVAVLTLLSDVLDVPPRYETAVENALAEKINCYVLGDIEGVKRAAAYMKEGAHDRTAFTSADLAAAPPSPPLAASLAPSHAASHAAPLAASLAASHAAPLEEATPGQGSAIRMSAVVSVRGPYAGIVNAALDEFIIATDLDHALDIRARLAAHAALSLSFSAPSASPRETSVLPLGQSSGQDAGRDAGQDAVPFAPSAPPRETSVLPLGQSSGRDAAQSSAQPSAPSGIVVRPRIVTLEGDVVEPSGMVVTGKKGGVLKHVRQIRELKDKLARRGDGIGRLEKDLSARIAEKEDRRREAKGVSELVFKLEKDLSVSKLNISRQVEDKEKTQKKLYYLKVESEGFLKEIASFQTMLAEKEQYLKDLTVKKEETDRHIQEIRDGITEKRARADVVRHSLTEKKMSAANDRERQRAAAAERAAALRKFNSLSAKTASVENEIEALGIKEKAWAAEILVKEEEALVIKDKLLKAAEDTQREKEGLERENAALLAAEGEITALRHEIDSLRKRTGELEVRQAEVRLRMENIHTAVSNNYGRDIREVETPHPLPPLLPHPLPPLLKERGLGGEAGGEAESEEERLGLLRRKIQDIGPVNLASIEEYRELKTRYDFLDTQRNDLSKSIEELQQAISRINYTTRQRLGDAFSNLNLRFNETFKLFFGGGSARLILTDSDNILESGIDIEVQPPEKKLQNINLLSGGEKTLTAISLIFAGFLLKPTPLCIMDEADAALDESNTRRFTNMIKTLAMNTQFILITHNRITMEIADYIYGITNEEPGVSKVISVQFAEA